MSRLTCTDAVLRIIVRPNGQRVSKYVSIARVARSVDDTRARARGDRARCPRARCRAPTSAARAGGGVGAHPGTASAMPRRGGPLSSSCPPGSKVTRLSPGSGSGRSSRGSWRGPFGEEGTTRARCRRCRRRPGAKIRSWTNSCTASRVRERVGAGMIRPSFVAIHGGPPATQRSGVLPIYGISSSAGLDSFHPQSHSHHSPPRCCPDEPSGVVRDPVGQRHGEVSVERHQVSCSFFAMRVLLDVSAVPPDPRGAGVYVVELARGLGGERRPRPRAARPAR